MSSAVAKSGFALVLLLCAATFTLAPASAVTTPPGGHDSGHGSRCHWQHGSERNRRVAEDLGPTISARS